MISIRNDSHERLVCAAVFSRAWPSGGRGDHWAFQPVKRPEAPGQGLPIDAFIQAKLQANGLTTPHRLHAPLIRRLHIVMHGCRRLRRQSPHSFDPDPRHFPNWLKRCWPANDTANAGPVVARPGSVRRNDRVRNQPRTAQRVALSRLGDRCVEAASRTTSLCASNLRAMHWMRLSAQLPRRRPERYCQGQDPKLGKMQRMNELDDMINTTGTTFLGLTTGCARCHDHKFDPISQRDYYAMQAVFAGVAW